MEKKGTIVYLVKADLGNENDINKIFHYGRADLAFIKNYLKTSVENINDTKIASRLARSYSDKQGLKDLITWRDLNKSSN